MTSDNEDDVKELMSEYNPEDNEEKLLAQNVNWIQCARNADKKAKKDKIYKRLTVEAYIDFNWQIHAVDNESQTDGVQEIADKAVTEPTTTTMPHNAQKAEPKAQSQKPLADLKRTHKEY